MAFQFTDAYIDILNANKKTLVETLGWQVIQQVVYDVLCGKNLRDLTEPLTRRRLAILNAALLAWAIQEDSWDELLQQAAQTLQNASPKAQRWTAQWLLGLTDKGRQNILRDKDSQIESYVLEYKNAIQAIVRESEDTFGALNGNFHIGQQTQNINWEALLYLMSAVGAQTLTVRGSEKLLYGKFFEPLVLGTLLFSLGFQFCKDAQHIPPQPHNVFWLSSKFEKRESDATLIYKPGKGARFDIGFIGRGNPEISLDKVSRFERKADFDRQKYDIITIILIDRIGRNSAIETQAQAINGHIIQMSMGYWPAQVARVLQTVLGFTHPILKYDNATLQQHLKQSVLQAPLSDLLFTE